MISESSRHFSQSQQVHCVGHGLKEVQCQKRVMLPSVDFTEEVRRGGINNCFGGKKNNRV